MVTDTSRQALLAGDLSRVEVDIIGLGMHGSLTAFGLARLGVGSLRLWDGDIVAEENLATQLYRPSDVGTRKTEALANVLATFGYIGEVICKDVFTYGESLRPVVICCADSMAVRKDAAMQARNSRSRLFIESRSARHDLFLHAFEPTGRAVAHYLDNYFPESVESVACGATGTMLMGMQVATLAGSLLTLSKGGDFPRLIPGEHEVFLGTAHIAKPWNYHQQ